MIRSGSAHVVVDRKANRVVTLGPGQWFGEEVFQQAVQIERRRSSMVTGELNRQIQAMQLAAALTASGDLAAAAKVRQEHRVAATSTSPTSGTPTRRAHAPVRRRMSNADTAMVLTSANTKVLLALSDDEETLPCVCSART